MPQRADTVILAEIGNRLRAIRRAYGLTQAGVAEVLGVDQSLWSKWERGTRAPDLLRLMDFAHRAQTSIELICFGVMFRTDPELVKVLHDLAVADHTIVFRAESHNFNVANEMTLHGRKRVSAGTRS